MEKAGNGTEDGEDQDEEDDDDDDDPGEFILMPEGGDWTEIRASWACHLKVASQKLTRLI